jgi:hypothetical protein
MTTAYPVPNRPIRDIYTAIPEVVSEPESWEKVRISVYRNEVEGTKTKIAEYGRNYSMLDTFEPFRQLRDGIWHDYALVSDRYTRLAVLDLATGTIAATESYPAATEDYVEMVKKHNPKSTISVGDPIPGSGFCPAAFYVPDFFDDFKSAHYATDEEMEKDIKSTTDALTCVEGSEADRRFAEEWSAEYLWSSSGQWGVYAGCVWGDDSSYKLRYVDLSKVSEGVVTTDDRFGYVELPEGKLKELVTLEAESKRIIVSVPVRFDVSTGKAPFFSYMSDYINWDKK